MRGLSMADWSMCLFALSLVEVCGAVTVQSCSSISCDHTGSAMLNTSEWYRNTKSCDWSLRDENSTTLEVVTPSANVSISCSRSEVYLKVLCDNPKYEIVDCYKPIMTNPEDGAASHFGASHSRALVPAYVTLAVVVMVLIMALRCTRRQQCPIAAYNN